MNNLSKCCQLHERIEIHYYVDHWVAQLFTADYEGRLVMIGGGDSVKKALQALNKKLEGLTLDDIRKLPELRVGDY